MLHNEAQSLWLRRLNPSTQKTGVINLSLAACALGPVVALLQAPNKTAATERVNASRMNPEAFA